MPSMYLRTPGQHSSLPTPLTNNPTFCQPYPANPTPCQPYSLPTQSLPLPLPADSTPYQPYSLPTLLYSSLLPSNPTPCQPYSLLALLPANTATIKTYSLYKQPNLHTNLLPANPTPYHSEPTWLKLLQQLWTSVSRPGA
jgi:hypothetical protein